MELLEELHNQGFKVELIDNHQVAIRPKNRLTPDLIEKLKSQKSALIQALSKQKQANGYLTKGQDEKNDLERPDGPIYENSKWCKGYQPPRWVHREVCAWHLQEADPKCMGCEHLTVRDKETLMDNYLDKAINKLNTLYQPNDRISWANRTEVNKLEQKITQAFLRHDVEGFKRLVDDWFEVFEEMRVPRCGR